MKSVKIICIIVYIFITIVKDAEALSTKLPKDFIQCKISGPDFDGCLKDAIEKAIPHLVKGVPSLNLIKIDPLRIIALEIDQGTGPVSIKLNFNDLDIINIRHVLVNRIHYDAENYNLFMDLQNPSPILLDGDYQISGKVLILPIVGKGKCKITIKVSRIEGNVQLNPVIKNGEKYLNIERLTWKFTPTNLTLKLDNLFNGDKRLGDNMNLFLNENWREVMAELQPAIEEVFGAAFTKIGQEFLTRIPLNQIYID